MRGSVCLLVCVVNCVVNSVECSGRLRSTSCDHSSVEDQDYPKLCEYCLILQLDHDEGNDDYILYRMARRAHDDMLHTTPINNVFLTITQLSRRSTWHTQRQKYATLSLLNSQSRTRTLLKHQAAHKKMLVLMASKREPKLHQVIPPCPAADCTALFLLCANTAATADPVFRRSFPKV